MDALLRIFNDRNNFLKYLEEVLSFSLGVKKIVIVDALVD